MLGGNHAGSPPLSYTKRVRGLGVRQNGMRAGENAPPHCTTTKLIGGHKGSNFSRIAMREPQLGGTKQPAASKRGPIGGRKGSNFSRIAMRELQEGGTK